MSKDQSEHIQRLFDSFPAPRIRPETMVIYTAMLSSIPEDHFVKVIDWCILTCKGLPTIAEVLATHQQLFGTEAEQERDPVKMAMMHELFSRGVDGEKQA